MTQTQGRGIPAEDEKRVVPLELFFDLVFVFALTQVTTLMSSEPTWAGLGKGMLVLAAVWWAWGAYAWLTNYIDAEADRERLLLFAAMAAMLVAALAVPGAFSDDGILFGVAYALVRWLHIFVFAEANEDVDARQAIVRLSRTALPGPALLISAGALDGVAQAALWMVALAIDFSGPHVFGVHGFRVSPAHFAERFALIVIIALGESIVAVGAGLTGELDGGVVVAAALAIAIAIALWWAYFDVEALIGERRFRESHGDRRVSRWPGTPTLSAPPDGRRHHSRGVRHQEGDWACREATGGGAGRSAARWHCALLRRAHQLPTAERGNAQSAPAGERASRPDADPRSCGSGFISCAGYGGRALLRADRLRDDSLPRGAQADPPLC